MGLEDKLLFESPKIILDRAVKELKWTQDDVIFLSANYIQENLKRKNLPIMDLSSYKPVNYNAEKYVIHKAGLDYVEAARLDFQLILSAITSEKLLRQYFESKYVDKIRCLKASRESNYAQLIVDFINTCDFRRPNGKYMLLCASKAVLEDGRIMDCADFTTSLSNKVYKNNASADVIMDEVLTNFSKFYWLDGPESC